MIDQMIELIDVAQALEDRLSQTSPLDADDRSLLKRAEDAIFAARFALNEEKRCRQTAKSK